MKKLLLILGLMMVLMISLASAEMIDDFTGSLGTIAGQNNSQGYTYVVDYGTSEVIANDTLYVTNSESSVQFDYVDGQLIESSVLCDAGICQLGVGNYSDDPVAFKMSLYPEETYQVTCGSGIAARTALEVNTSKYHLLGLRVNMTNNSIDCYFDGAYVMTRDLGSIGVIDGYGFVQSSGISMYVDWISTDGSRPCTPNWSCSDYADCVSPANNVSCTNVTDVNSCGETYTGNYSEFETQECVYPSSSSSSGTRYLVDADGNIVGVSQNGGVVQSLVPENKAPFLSLAGGDSFDVKAWFGNLIANIKGWFVK